MMVAGGAEFSHLFYTEFGRPDSDNSHSQDCQFEGMTFLILRMSDIRISGFHYFEVSTFGWIDVKPLQSRSYDRMQPFAHNDKLRCLCSLLLFGTNVGRRHAKYRVFVI